MREERERKRTRENQAVNKDTMVMPLQPRVDQIATGWWNCGAQRQRGDAYWRGRNPNNVRETIELFEL